MADVTSTTVETPSGKEASYENFPVGSFLIRSELRSHVMAFYSYARAIDDIADNPDLPAEEKIRRLDGFDRAVTGELSGDPGYAKGYAMRDSLRAEYVAVTDEEALDSYVWLSRKEGIIPALEPSHAIAWVRKLAPTLAKDAIILVNLSGRGDKDAPTVRQILEERKSKGS